MDKILNTKGLGVAGRQNELIELALTFKFNGIQVDMNDLIGRHDTMGKEFACQFIESAKINNGLTIGSFDLPIVLDANDAEFEASCEKLETIFSLCESLGGTRCRVAVSTSSDEPFQQNFERHRTRLSDLGDKFAAHGIKLGLALQSPGANEKENKFIQSAEELLTLVKTVGHDSVGICLDTWQFKAAGGAMDQVTEIDASKVVEIMMADISDGADPANLSAGDRVLPGQQDQSFSVDVFNALKKNGFDGGISFATHPSNYANVSRDRIVNRISKRLDCLIAGESFDTIVEKTLAETMAAAQAESVEKPAETPENEKKEDTKADETATAS